MGPIEKRCRKEIQATEKGNRQDNPGRPVNPNSRLKKCLRPALYIEVPAVCFLHHPAFSKSQQINFTNKLNHLVDKLKHLVYICLYERTHSGRTTNHGTSLADRNRVCPGYPREISGSQTGL